MAGHCQWTGLEIRPRDSTLFLPGQEDNIPKMSRGYAWAGVLITHSPI